MNGLTRAVAGLVVLSLSAADAAQGARPVALSKAEAAKAIAEIEKDRVESQTWLRADPTSYLATVARENFGDRTALTVGRAADNDVRLDDPGIAAHHLQVTVAGDSFKVEAIDKEASFKVKDTTERVATIVPSYIEVGRFKLRLSHQRFPAIIVFDPKSPHFKDYKGFDYFPIDLSYRYELPLTPNPKPDVVIIMSTVGNARRALRVGWFDFTIGKASYRLEATRLLEPGVGEKDMAVFFRDATSEKETYALGRYVDPKALPNGRYLLDFNNAYNPACAYSDHYNCPIPPKSNTLTVAIRAGERDSHYH